MSVFVYAVFHIFVVCSEIKIVPTGQKMVPSLVHGFCDFLLCWLIYKALTSYSAWH
jgi:hypothetical protein